MSSTKATAKSCGCGYDGSRVGLGEIAQTFPQQAPPYYYYQYPQYYPYPIYNYPSIPTHPYTEQLFNCYPPNCNFSGTCFSNGYEMCLVDHTDGRKKIFRCTNGGWMNTGSFC